MNIRAIIKMCMTVPLGLAIISGWAVAAEPVLADYTAYPIFTVNPVKPNIMIMLDNSGSMNQNAYGSAATNGQEITDQPYRGIPYPYTVSYKVSTSADDAEEHANGNTSINNGSPDLDFGRFSTSDTSTVGIRFQGLDIPKDAVITDAWLEFTVQRVPNGTEGVSANEYAPISLDIIGEASDSAPLFENTNYNITSRPATTNTVEWNDTDSPKTITWGPVNEVKKSPDISTIVQEIVNREGWEKGNAMAFKIQYHSIDSHAKRDAYSFDGSNNDAPVLFIEYKTKKQEQYYGYFNPEWFYTHSSNKYYHAYKKVDYNYASSCWNVIYPTDLGAPPADEADWNSLCLDNAGIVSRELWDGNWMNWASMRRIDIARKVIMGGKATSRQGGGNQTSFGEDPAQGNRHFKRKFDSSAGSAVTPYSDGSNIKWYGVQDGYLTVDTNDNNNPFSGRDRFVLAIDKLQDYDGRDFDDDGNLAGVMQKYWDKAYWGNEFFYSGSGSNREGGQIVSPIGTNLSSLITDLQNTGADTWTPLAESYYVAKQYFMQEKADSNLGYSNSCIGAVNNTNDPYYQDKEFIECAPSFVIMLTDGASTMDGQIPGDLKDYDGDGVDNTACNEYNNTNCDYATGGTDYLDDVALYARTNDLRADLDGDQNLILYTVYAFGNDPDARNLLRDAARNGGFEDLNGNNRPDGAYSDPPEDRLEWDFNGDGDPDTFFEAQDGYKLESALGDAINNILKRASSGTAVSVLATSSEGEGNLSQAYFRPEVKTAKGPVKWLGYLQSLWIDNQSNLREDTNANHALDPDEDLIIRYNVDAQGNTVVRKYAVNEIVCTSTEIGLSDDEACFAAPDDTEGLFNDNKCSCVEINYPEIDIVCESTDSNISDDAACADVDGESNGLFNSGQCLCDDGAIAAVPMDQITPIWEAGKRLAMMTDPDHAANGRKLFTSLDGEGDGLYHGGIEFSTINAASIQPFLGIKDAVAWSYLGEYSAETDQTDRTVNLIRFVRGFNEGFSGETLIRSRAIEVDGAERVWRLGDIVHSTPVTVAQPMDNYGLIYRDESYDHYYRHHQKRESVVYVGANDGILHAFASWQYNEENRTFTRPDDANEFENIGDELWGYIPRALLPHLKWLPRTDYTHVYYVDLKPKVVDVKIFTPDLTDHIGGWGTVLIGGLRMGGKPIDVTDSFEGTVGTETFSSSYFAIDITDPRNPELLWEKTYNGLNLTTMRPNVVKVGDKWFVVLGSGPDSYEGSSASKAKIYVADIASGDLYNDGSTDWLFETSEDKSFMGGVASLDYRLNYNVDSIYLSQTYDDSNNQDPDWKGSMYRVAVPWSCAGSGCETIPYGTVGTQGSCVCSYDYDPLTWEMGKLYESQTPLTAEPSLTTDYFKNIWVHFGTGRYLSEADKSTTDTNYLIGLKDPYFNKAHKEEVSGYTYGTNATNRPYYLDFNKNLTLVPGDLFGSDDFEVFFPWGYYEAPAGDCSSVPTGAVGDIYGDGSCIASYDWPEIVCEPGLLDPACVGVTGDDIGTFNDGACVCDGFVVPDWGCVEKVSGSGACDDVLEGEIADNDDYKALYWEAYEKDPGGCTGVNFGEIVDTAECASTDIPPPAWSTYERPIGDCTGVTPPMAGDIADDGGSCYAGYWACDETVANGCDNVDFTAQTGMLGADADGDINGDDSCLCGFVTDPVARVISATSTAYLTFPEIVTQARSREGWMRTLYDPKERSVEKATNFGGLSLFSTYVPSDAICSFGGNSYLYAVYFETGTAFQRAVFEDGTTYNDFSNEILVKDRIDLGLGMASTPSIHVGRQEGNKAEVLINKSTGEIKGIEIDPAFNIRSGLRYWQN